MELSTINLILTKEVPVSPIINTNYYIVISRTLPRQSLGIDLEKCCQSVLIMRAQCLLNKFSFGKPDKETNHELFGGTVITNY